MAKRLTTGCKHIDKLLTPAAMRLWHSDEYKELPVIIHRWQWRVLATYFCDIVALQKIRVIMAAEEKKGNPYVSDLKGQGQVMSAMAKQEAATEKRLRDAETRLQLLKQPLEKEISPSVDEERMRKLEGKNFG